MATLRVPRSNASSNNTQGSNRPDSKKTGRTPSRKKTLYYPTGDGKPIAEAQLVRMRAELEALRQQK